MTYPTLEQYQEVLQHPRTAFLDSELTGGKVATTGLGMPLAMCGGFALTYTVTVGGRKLAVRCFHKESRELQQRYDAVSSVLRSLRSPYFVPFDFLKSGVRVNGVDYPIVKMAWAQGTTLGEFVEQYHRDSARVAKLIEALRNLALYLESQGIAHGDIQPGNVMVSQDGASIQLIDYDGMFVPGLANMKSAELGHRNFQHPRRTDRNFNAQLDRFSFITIDLALRALLLSPQLWTTTQCEPESFVFRANDFADPASSETFATLSRLSRLTREVSHFASICGADIVQTPSLSEFVAGRSIPAAPVYITPAATGSGRRAPYMGQYPVLDASNYQRVHGYVGQMVELVGEVIDVGGGMSRRGGRPYVFVNFGDWRGKCVKLAIWSDALEKMRVQPDSSWKGRWLSVKGLVDPPYSNPKREYTHLSITISSPGLVQQIAGEEARYRLALVNSTVRTSSRSDANSKLLASLGSSPATVIPTRSSSVPPNAANSTASGNQKLLDQMRNRASTSSRTTAPPSVPATVTRRTSRPSPGAAPQPASRIVPASSNGVPQSKSSGEEVPGWVYVVAVAILVILLKAIIK
ncbi:hypothetical protein BG58_32405 [Caballeronia jiangsuensis]|nr:hypothetical protein BG58_32405 [Caballeronia jiangsuensis]